MDLAPAADEVLDVVGPHAGRVDDLAGPHVQLGAGLQVAHTHPGDPLPSRRKPTACAREATCAPYVAAVRSVVITKRASSTWASQYCTAPVKADLRNEGATRSAWRRVRWRCPGTPRVRPKESPSVS
ncbi:hypothetical protein GCM10027612_21230 [Microbispora bryophytorum subsp. camponoti]